MKTKEHIGKTLEEFATLGLLWRISKKDGEYRIVTMELNPNRYSLEVENNIIVGYYMG